MSGAMLDTPIYISVGALFLVLVLAAEYFYQRRQKKQRN
jgi:preprotein translocase subunit YajC